jgi:hypothetical protein
MPKGSTPRKRQTQLELTSEFRSRPPFQQLRAGPGFGHSGRSAKVIAGNPLFQYHMNGLALVMEHLFGTPVDTFVVEIGNARFTYHSGSMPEAERIPTPGL